MAEPEFTPQSPEPAAPAAIPENWKDTLHQDLRADPTIANVQSVEDLARMTISAQKMVGANKIGLPGADASDDDWAAVYDALGRPRDGTGYQLVAPAGLPDGLNVDAELEQAYRSKAHELGLLPGQAAGLFSWFLGANGDRHSTMVSQANAAHDAAEAALKRNWGQSYDTKLGQANRAVRAFGGDALVEFLAEKGLSSEPHMVRLMATIGERMSEDRPERGSPRDGFAMSPDQTRAEIAKLQTDREFQKTYQDAHDPGHTFAVQRMQKLFEQAYGTDVVSGTSVA